MKRNLYPPIEPFAASHLSVGAGHEIYLEQSGNRYGIPVVFVHGGPGGGTSPLQRRFFDPSKYHIILFDQRGCGKSRPHASLENNTSWDLVADMEAIRLHLNIDQWIVFGGSWGSTLALLYAEKYPEKILNLVLRGIFLLRQKELDWFYGPGSGSIFPEAWDEFLAPLSEEERKMPIQSYYDILTGDDLERQLEAAQAWSVWESSTVTLVQDRFQIEQARDPYFALPFARIEAHYFVHKGWLEEDNQILRDTYKLKNIPTTIVQGRYDAICPPVSAYELKKAMPWAKLKIVDVAGHSAFEPDILHELIKSMDQIAQETDCS
ncbi:prolyl aminopeptidase [Temperatibacter marinus]|uniref:Proline iminopeptidase n=1 Tax=Temperatibacter marinus TaxID=1456591 RepID=A0AA52EHS7_9PROT|nr:prolyl aminopeptidase [Temperatibacter marinus]WND03408.1 prolyl aminopeptidase [Temperatibacter marinus]